jgi:hypothetical protein
MIGYASIVGLVNLASSGIDYYVDSNSVGTFLCFAKMPFVSAASIPDRVYTRELTITRISTEVDPSTGTIPADEVVFRTRHIDRRQWGGGAYWERRTSTFNSFTLIYTHSFRWVAGAPFGSTQINVESRKRFYDPFVPVLDVGTVSVTSSDPAIPDTYLDDVKTDVDGQAFASGGYYNADPEWCFFPVEIKPGQSLQAVTRWYKESAVSYDATAGEYTTPFLDDSVPNSGPSGSEDEVSALATFDTVIYLLRI